MKSALAITIISLAILPYPIFAAENVLGDWEFEFENPTFMANKTWSRSGTLTITRNADGSYEGKMQTQNGECTLSEVTLKNNILRFSYDETVAGVKIKAKSRCRVMVQGTKMTGQGNGVLGRFDFAGDLQGQPHPGPDAVVGTWKINITQARTYKEHLTIFKNPDGSLAGKWDPELDKLKRLAWDIKFTDPNLSFADRYENKKRAMTCLFQGVVKGDTITGTYTKPNENPRPMTAIRIVPDNKP